MKKIITILLLVLAIKSPAQWSQINNGITGLSQGVVFLGHSANYIFAGTYTGFQLYRSNDNGNNWTPTNLPLPFQIPVCAHFFSGKYFAGLNYSGDCIMYTTDDGATWSTVAGSPATTVVRGFIDHAGVIYAYTSSKGIYLSTDGGATWVQSNNGLTNLNVASMSSINNKVIATTIGGGVYISTDSGNNWVQSNTGIAGSALNGTYTWRLGTNLIYQEQAGSKWLSSDEGATWSAFPATTYLPVGPFVYRNEATGHVYGKTRHFQTSPFALIDSIFFTADEGVTWQNITGNLPSNWDDGYIHEHNGYAYVGFSINQPNLGIYRWASPTGINAPSGEAALRLSVYPNPTSSSFTVVTKNAGSVNEVRELRMRNTAGQVVFRTTVSVPEITIDGKVTGAPGIYLIEALDENNAVTAVERVVIN